MSCHIVLEYDELRILNDLGHEVTVIGGYIEPKTPHVSTRPPLNINHDKYIVDKVHKFHTDNMNKGVDLDMCSKILTKEFVDYFDCIIVIHRLDWIELNWDLFKHKNVILRTIGQNTKNEELKLKSYIDKGVKVLRYSPKEREIEGYAGESGLIRFLKYESDFLPRNKSVKRTLTFCQSIHERGKFCFYDDITSLTNLDQLKYELYGIGNVKSKYIYGEISYDEQLMKLMTYGSYLYTGTYPAHYTLNFIEAMMSGIPIVTFGRKWFKKYFNDYLPEVHDILDKISLIHYYEKDERIIYMLNELNNDDQLNKEISDKQREVANNLFSAEKNIYKWKEFLE